MGEVSYCQHNEEEVLFELIGDQREGVVFDVGARLSGSNTARLILERGFGGVLVEKSQKEATKLDALYVHSPDVWVHHVEATFDNINDLAPPFIDVCSIDVDSIDWWLWARLEVNPKIMVVEANMNMKSGVAPYRLNLNWRKNPYGASVDAFMKLAEIKGYEFVKKEGVNLIFRRGQ